MEGISTHVYKGLKKYWNRRGYVRLNQGKKKTRTHITLGQNGPDPTPAEPKRRRYWRVKISPRIRIWRRVGSPKKWLTRLRDAYVNMMLKVANTGFAVGSNTFGGSLDYGYVKGPVKEYDEKMIVEIYKSLMIAQGKVVPRAGNNDNNVATNHQNNPSSQHRIISISAK